MRRKKGVWRSVSPHLAARLVHGEHALVAPHSVGTLSDQHGVVWIVCQEAAVIVVVSVHRPYGRTVRLRLESRRATGNACDTRGE